VVRWESVWVGFMVQFLEGYTPPAFV